MIIVVINSHKDLLEVNVLRFPLLSDFVLMISFFFCVCNSFQIVQFTSVALSLFVVTGETIAI